MTDIHALLKLMADSKASHLLLTVGAAPCIRTAGHMRKIEAPALAAGEVKTMACALMTPAQANLFETAMEANFAVSVDGIGRFRINIYQQRGEMAMVVRLIRSHIPDFEQLGLPPRTAQLAMEKRGLVLVAGAAGCGKSTTLAAMIEHRAKMADGHILTIEDPIEFLFRHHKALVDQREVGIDTHTFADALYNAMREAPDVIMIGEIRDRDTAQYAISFAQAGHLCLSTVHANGADQAIDRFLRFFPEEARAQVAVDLGTNLKGVLAQRLVETTDGAPALAAEVLLVTPYIAELIEKRNLGELKHVMANSTAQGMKTFDQSLLELVAAHRITDEEAARHADAHTDLVLRLRLSHRQAGGDAPAFALDGGARGNPP